MTAQPRGRIEGVSIFATLTPSFETGSSAKVGSITVLLISEVEVDSDPARRRDGGRVRREYESRESARGLKGGISGKLTGESTLPLSAANCEAILGGVLVDLFFDRDLLRLGLESLGSVTLVVSLSSSGLVLCEVGNVTVG